MEDVFCSCPLGLWLFDVACLGRGRGIQAFMDATWGWNTRVPLQVFQLPAPLRRGRLAARLLSPPAVFADVNADRRCHVQFGTRRVQLGAQ